MAQVCRVCAHPNTKEMEEAYINNIPKTRIAKKHGINVQSVDYHMDNHLSDKLVKAVRQKELDHTENILSGIKNLLDRTKDILDQAESKGQKRLALDAIKEARSTYELLSKIAVKLEEYRRKDEEKETGLAEQQLTKGLEVLSDAELKAYIQLQGKIVSADSDYEFDPSSRYIVDAMNSITPQGFNSSLKDPGFDPDSPDDGRQNSASQDRNSLTDGSEDDDLLLDDLDDLDLELDDLSNEIPSEQSDPEWLREERRRRRRRRR